MMEWPLPPAMFQAFPPILADACAAARPLWIPIPQGIGLVTSWL